MRRVLVGLGVALAITATGIASAGGGDAGKLKLVDALLDGQGGALITDPDDLTVSRDGDNVYVTNGQGSVSAFKRRGDGTLKFLGAKVEDQGGVEGLDGANNIVVTPNGRYVYAASSVDGAVVAFKRKDDGTLKYLQTKSDDQGGVDGISDAIAIAASADNQNIYVTGGNDNAVAVFELRSDGRLRFLQVKVDNQGGVDGIDNPFGVAVAGDGDNVYVTASDEGAVATFKRKGNGKLAFVNAKFDGQGGVEGLEGAYDLTVSADDDNVYVVNGADGIVIFKRKANGKLRFREALFEGGAAGPHFTDPYDVAASDDGRNVYVSAYQGSTESAVVTFRRNRNTGLLTFLNTRRDGVGDVDEVAGIWRVAISPDGDHVYAAAYSEPSVGIFKRKG